MYNQMIQKDKNNNKMTNNISRISRINVKIMKYNIKTSKFNSKNQNKNICNSSNNYNIMNRILYRINFNKFKKNYKMKLV